MDRWIRTGSSDSGNPSRKRDPSRALGFFIFTYRTEKAKLILQKKSLDEEMISLSHKQNDWLEPMLAWLKVAQNLNGIARDTDLFAKKVCAKEIFGSHLLLGEKTIRPAEGGNPNSLANSLAKTGETAWACLRHAHSLVGSQPLSSILVRSAGVEPASAAWKAAIMATIRRPLFNTCVLYQ